jgi:hypothetical protein
VNWPSWNESAVVALMAMSIAFVLPRLKANSRAFASVTTAAREFALVAALYAVWRLARQLPLTHQSGAVERASQIVDLQERLHLPSELSLQHFVLGHDWLGWLTNTYYAVVHVPATILFLLWLFVAHRDHYPHWRNVLAMVTGACLLIRFVRVTPPRLMPGLGYIDLATIHGFNIYGPPGTGVSDQFAAMPSMHVAWAAVVSFGILAAGASWMRWLLGLHVAATMFVVSASGHHWWMDGIVALVLLGGAVVLERWVRRRLTGRQEVIDLQSAAESQAPAAEPVASAGPVS